MKKLFLALSLLVGLNAMSQDETVKKLSGETKRTITKEVPDTLTYYWKKGGLYSFNISQGSLSNWAAGGDNFSLAANSLLSLYAFHKNGKHVWDNTFDFNLGYVNTTSLGSRKNDDRFDLLSKYGYEVAPKWYISGLFNLRSQFFEGYTYESADVKSLASNFMAPGYILLSAGMDYKPNANFSVFLSPITSRWVIVGDERLSKLGLYGVEPGKKSALEMGAFASANYFKEFSPKVTYKGRLDLFSNYKHNPQNIDLYMTNAINLKLTKVLSATYGLDLVYDDDARLFGKNNDKAALQIKSIIGIGLLVNF